MKKTIMMAMAACSIYGCADPYASTLNQVCVFDTDCDDGQFCKKLPEEPDGLCKVGDANEVSSSSSTGPASGSEPTMTGGTTGPMPSSGVTTLPTESTSTTAAVTTASTTDTATSSSTTDTTLPETGSESSTSGGPVGCDAVIRDQLGWNVTSLPGYSDTQGIGVGDLDNDGNTDLVVSASDPWGLTTLLGDGFGSFSVGQAVDLPLPPSWVEVGAISDDNADVVVLLPANEQFARYLGNGGGGLGSSAPYSFLEGELLLTDVNNDGDLDVLSWLDHDFVLALGNGDETFAPPQVYAGGTGEPATGITAGDFNDDGFVDAALAHQSGGSVVAALFDGASLEEEGPYPVGGFPADLVAGDLDADDFDDLAVGQLEGGAWMVRIHQSNGDGTFSSTSTALGISTVPSAMQIADLEGDGDNDVVVANGGVVAILYGNGLGGFVGQSVESCGGSLTDLEIADLDGDCVLDIVATDSAGDEVCVLLSDL